MVQSSLKPCTDQRYIVIVALRLYCRTQVGRRKLLGALGLDDLVTLICLLIVLVACILGTVAAGWGLGKHFDSLNEEHQVQSMKYNAIIDAVVIWGFSTPKFAIVCLLKRILNHGIKTSILFWTLALIGQIVILATSIWVFKQCDPVDYQWEQFRTSTKVAGTCGPIHILTNIGYFGSSYSAFLDVFFAIYPVPFVMKLRMPMRNRVSISLSLSLGAVACTISVYKLSILGKAFAIMGDDPTCEFSSIERPARDSLTYDISPDSIFEHIGHLGGLRPHRLRIVACSGSTVPYREAKDQQ